MKKRSTKKLTIENIFAPKTTQQAILYFAIVAIIFPLIYQGNLLAAIGIIFLMVLFLIFLMLERYEEANILFNKVLLLTK
jgi:hypothetical protein